MTNEVRLFNNEEFGNVRVLTEDDEILFCASDVAKALGHTNSRKAVNDHCRCVTKRYVPHPQSPNKEIEMSFIPESDVYRLTFSSKLPNAEKFTDWVTKEVLPGIRKNGIYATKEAAEQFLNDPRKIAEILLDYADAKDKIVEQQKKIEEKKETIIYAQESIEHKEDVIEGLTENVPVAELRQRITNIIRQSGMNYRERWTTLYEEFSSAYHINLNLQYKRYGDEYKSKIDFVDGYLNMIPQLFAVACNLFENDAKTYLTRIRDSIATNSEAVDTKKKALKKAKARFAKKQSNVIDFTKAAEG